MIEKYIELKVTIAEQDQKDRLMAMLFPLGFDGVEENTTGLKACGPTESVDIEALEILFQKEPYEYTIDYIPDQNWNALWERNFEPVRLLDFAGVRAHFHPPFEPKVQYDILITPKMSFGTGHHATTRLMMELMQMTPIAGQSLLDFGTGTGILGILACKLGAATVIAIDNDDWSITNAMENFATNGCQNYRILKADSLATFEPVHTICANINKHILLEAAPFFADKILPGGYLLLSGLLQADAADLENALPSEVFEKLETRQEGDWVALLFRRKVV